MKNETLQSLLLTNLFQRRIIGKTLISSYPKKLLYGEESSYFQAYAAYVSIKKKYGDNNPVVRLAYMLYKDIGYWKEVSRIITYDEVQ